MFTVTHLLRGIIGLHFVGDGNVTQAQQDSLERIPLWVWIVGSLIVVLIGVLWTLREEKELAKQTRPATIPEPVSAVKPEAAEPATEPEPVEPGPVQAPEPEPIEAPPPKPDNLKRVSGIGPKVSGVLNENGIFTFEQLAATEVSFLQQLMEEREWQFADPTTWPEQARQLAEEKGKKQGDD